MSSLITSIYDSTSSHVSLWLYKHGNPNPFCKVHSPSMHLLTFPLFLCHYWYHQSTFMIFMYIFLTFFFVVLNDWGSQIYRPCSLASLCTHFCFNPSFGSVGLVSNHFGIEAKAQIKPSHHHLQLSLLVYTLMEFSIIHYIYYILWFYCLPQLPPTCLVLLICI